MVTIQTRPGTIHGIDRNHCEVFLGIPYAAPPVDDNRWMPPRPAPGWTGSLDATKYPFRSYQPPYPAALAGRDIPGEHSEDCLYLNIYTPKADHQRRPVMFWIHGGAYIQGSANEYDGAQLATDNDVVVVCINYRLGIFGFTDLSALGDEFSGSASLGFQDQIAALTWVKQNIEDYGGDPDSVTIFGESAGGGSVLALLAAPSAKGLFHKAIAFSPGEPTGPAGDGVAPLSKALDLKGPALRSKLMGLPAKDLFALQQNGSANTGAAVDGKIITAQPSTAIRAAGRDGVPLITGCNKDEGSFMADVFAPDQRELMIQRFGEIIGNGDSETYLSHLKTLVPGGDLREKLVRIWYDLFRSSALRTAEASSESGAGGWVYNFEVPGNTPLGVAHGADVAFTFNTLNSDAAGFGFHDPGVSLNRETSAVWSRTFANFARTGDPNGGGLPEWRQYRAPDRACLVVGERPAVVNDPDGELLRQAYGMS